MPSWWFEATLATSVFGGLFLMWVILPPRLGEDDFGSRVREWILRPLRRRLVPRGAGGAIWHLSPGMLEIGWGRIPIPSVLGLFGSENDPMGRRNR